MQQAMNHSVHETGVASSYHLGQRGPTRAPQMYTHSYLLLSQLGKVVVDWPGSVTAARVHCTYS